MQKLDLIVLTQESIPLMIKAHEYKKVQLAISRAMHEVDQDTQHYFKVILGIISILEGDHPKGLHQIKQALLHLRDQYKQKIFNTITDLLLRELLAKNKNQEVIQLSQTFIAYVKDARSAHEDDLNDDEMIFFSTLYTLQGQAHHKIGNKPQAILAIKAGIDVLQFMKNQKLAQSNLSEQNAEMLSSDNKSEKENPGMIHLFLDAKNHEIYGKKHLSRHQYGSAVNEFKQALHNYTLLAKETQDDEKFKKNFQKNILFMYDYLGQCFVLQNKFQEAETHFTAAIDRAIIHSPRLAWYYLLRRGLLYLQNNPANLQKAYSDFRGAQATDDYLKTGQDAYSIKPSESALLRGEITKELETIIKQAQKDHRLKDIIEPTQILLKLNNAALARMNIDAIITPAPPPLNTIDQKKPNKPIAKNHFIHEEKKAEPKKIEIKPVEPEPPKPEPKPLVKKKKKISKPKPLPKISAKVNEKKREQRAEKNKLKKEKQAMIDKNRAHEQVVITTKNIVQQLIDHAIIQAEKKAVREEEERTKYRALFQSITKEAIVTARHQRCRSRVLTRPQFDILCDFESKVTRKAATFRLYGSLTFQYLLAFIHHAKSLSLTDHSDLDAQIRRIPQQNKDRLIALFTNDQFSWNSSEEYIHFSSKQPIDQKSIDFTLILDEKKYDAIYDPIDITHCGLLIKRDAYQHAHLDFDENKHILDTAFENGYFNVNLPTIQQRTTCLFARMIKYARMFQDILMMRIVFPDGSYVLSPHPWSTQPWIRWLEQYFKERFALGKIGIDACFKEMTQLIKQGYLNGPEAKAILCCFCCKLLAPIYKETHIPVANMMTLLCFFYQEHTAPLNTMIDAIQNMLKHDKCLQSAPMPDRLLQQKLELLHIFATTPNHVKDNKAGGLRLKHE